MCSIDASYPFPKTIIEHEDNDLNNLIENDVSADCREGPVFENARATAHGLSRIMERTGKDLSHSMDLTRKAWRKGKASGIFNTMWDQHSCRLQTACDEKLTEHRIYKGNLFIFSQDKALITMFPLPEDYYHRRAYYDGKTRVRRAKRYFKMNSMPSLSGGIHPPLKKESVQERRFKK